MKNLGILLFFCCIVNITLADIPAGYYHKTNYKFGNQLLKTLDTICSNGNFLSYGSGDGHTWQGFYYTDRNEDGSIIDMYSSVVRYQTDFNGVEGLHIEHSLPKSWWGSLENYAFRDLHHLFPADATTNITKNNLPLGEVETATFNNGISKIGITTLYGGKEKCFEPFDEYKGDFARAYFYISTIYNELYILWDSPMMKNNTYPIWNDEALELLLKWHRNDPVSEKELKRQEAIYQIQHNRNPFIDYPEMIEHIWGNKKDIPFELPQEQRPFITTPNQWTKINIPLSHIGTSTSEKIRFEGANFSENITLSLLNQSKEITISKYEITPQEISSGCELIISLSSNEIKTVIDTLLIHTIDTIKLPISVTFTDEFMLTESKSTSPTTADIKWIELPNTKDYEIILRNAPNKKTADLMFSAYTEGTSYNKAISIYNGTGQTINLKYYSIRKQSNGIGELQLNYPLSGYLPNNESYVIVNSRANDSLKSMADHIVQSLPDRDNFMNFNGNDAIALYHNGILIDIIGELNNSADWGKDISMKRNAEVVSPNSTFDFNEWIMYTKDDFSHLEKHHVILNTQSNIINNYKTTNNFITINNLTPNKKYYVELKSNNKLSTNLLTFTTPNIATPEAYNATDIYSTQFTANWEEVSYAKNYIINLMQFIGNKEVTIEENFDNIGSNGKPLPKDWSGNASGNYTSTASSGKSAPSIALKNTGEYIQTPITADPLTHIEFMYRFASKAEGSYFILYTVDKQGNLTQLDKIDYINTSKTTLTYNNLQNTYAIRIEYHKSMGNLAIDDVIYKYGESHNEIIQSEYTTNNWFTFKNLVANTTYSYNIIAQMNDTCVSDTSNTIIVTTNNTQKPTTIPEINKYKVNDIYYTTKNGIHLYNLPNNNCVTIYNIWGKKICEFNTTEYTFIPIEKQGIYIAKIKNTQNIITFKFIIK